MNHLTHEMRTLLYPCNVFALAWMVWLATTPSPLWQVSGTFQSIALFFLFRHLTYKANTKPAKLFVLKRDWLLVIVLFISNLFYHWLFD